MLLAAAALLGFTVLVILHNLLDALAGLPALGGMQRSLVQALAAIAFLGAALVCPPGLRARRARHADPGRV